MFRAPGSGARFNDNMWHTVLVTRETARVSADSDLAVLLMIATANKFEYRVKKNKVVLTIF